LPLLELYHRIFGHTPKRALSFVGPLDAKRCAKSAVSATLATVRRSLSRKAVEVKLPPELKHIRQIPNLWLYGPLLSLALVSTSGCSALAVQLGLRVRLEDLQVTAVTAALENTRNGSAISSLGPGQSAQLVIVATTKDGKQYATVGAGRGRVAFSNYTITATVVQVTKGGKVSLSSDPRVSDGKVAHLRIAPVAHPDIVAELDIPVRYDLAYVANYSGADGANGMDGNDGLDGGDGTDGAAGSVDPTTGVPGPQGPGGQGSDGGNGGDGSNGQDGSPGLAVHIWVRLESANTGKPLLQIKVTGGGRQSLYILDPKGGSLKVLDDGGAGGRGGSGGRGGRGGSGGAGNPPGMDGLAGQPGSDGQPGFAGAAGTITVSVDPAAQPFMSCITWSDRGGNGVPGPAPTITVEPVAALW
jgi:hypothetical protein